MSALIIRGYPATSEQEQIINCVVSGAPLVVVNAFAGTGKTSTLIGVTETFPSHAKMLYLAFNKSMAESAKSIFGRNVEVKTTHGFAMPHIINRGERVRGNYTAQEVSRMFGVENGVAYSILRSFETFCNSDLKDIPPKMPYRTYVERLFDEMDRGEVDKTHSFYLKKFQLNLVNSVPMRLKEYSLAMLDEFQDTNAVTRSIFENLKARQRIVVGDTHQNIYGFRGSENIMDSLSGEKFYLTNSFRFGEKIAGMATDVLSKFKGEKQSIKGRGTETIPRTAITLSRTNAYLVQNVMVYMKNKLYFKSIRDPELIFGLPINIARLNEGMDITHKQFTYLTWEKSDYEKRKANYKCFADYLVKKGRENDDGEMIWSGLVAQEYSVNELEDALEKTHDNNRSLEPCQWFLGTAHSAKGLEYDIVKINEDFKDPYNTIATWAFDNKIEADNGDYLASFINHTKGGLVKSSIVEEFNLFYVAVTRAKVEVHFDDNLVNPIGVDRDAINKAIGAIYESRKSYRDRDE